MLDFYLLGLARSGTTALARTLNAHKSIFCGIERFPIYLDPKEIIYPDTFLNAPVWNPEGLKHVEDHLAEGDKNITIIGDKNPRQFYKPNHLDKVKLNIVIYRNFADTISSWDVRASSNNAGWRSGRTGKLFFLDLYVFLLSIKNLENLHVVNYGEIFYGNYWETLKWLFVDLGVNHHDYSFEQFEEKIYNKRELLKKSRQSKPEYSKLVSTFKLLETDQECHSAKTPKQLSEALKNYGKFIEDNRDVLIGLLLESLNSSEYEELFRVSNLIARHFNKHQIAYYFGPPQNAHGSSKSKLFFDLLMAKHFQQIDQVEITMKKLKLACLRHNN